MDLKQIAVATAVAILFALFVGLLIDLVHEAPKYGDYCGDKSARPMPLEKPIQQECEQDYGEEYSQCIEKGGTPRFNYSESCPVFDYCDYCSLEFNQAAKDYNKNLFIIVGIIGLIAIFIGTLWRIDFLGTGLMFGGILLLIYGTARFFGDADKLLRVIIIFAELLIVIWIGYKKLR